MEVIGGLGGFESGLDEIPESEYANLGRERVIDDNFIPLGRGDGVNGVEAALALVGNLDVTHVDQVLRGFNLHHGGQLIILIALVFVARGEHHDANQRQHDCKY